MSEEQQKIEKALLGVEEAFEGLGEHIVISVMAVTFAAQYKDLSREALKYRLQILNEQVMQNYDKRKQ